MSSQTPPARRGHRVREFVGAYRTLRNEHGQPARLSTPALSEPRIAAAALAPLLKHEAVEIFGVACLSTRHRLLAWHVLSRGTRLAYPKHGPVEAALVGLAPPSRRKDSAVVGPSCPVAVAPQCFARL